LRVFGKPQSRKHIFAQPPEIIGKPPEVLLDQAHALISQAQLFHQVLDIFSGRIRRLRLGLGSYSAVLVSRLSRDTVR